MSNSYANIAAERAAFNAEIDRIRAALTDKGVSQ